MKRLPVTVALLAAASLGALAQQAPDQKAPSAATAPSKRVVQDVTPDQAEKLMKERADIVVLDVRTAEEFEMGHIAGAKNASFIDTEFQEAVKQVEGKPVIVHCAAGSRSARAVKEMSASGKFPEIYHLNSGLNGWSQAGKPVVKTPKAPK